MASNAFIGRAKKPEDSELAAELGKSKAAWGELLAELEGLGAGDLEWASYSVKSGWALKVIRKKRIIVYLSPMHGCFRASFVLGDKAVAAAKASKLPAKVLKLVSEGRRYAEGTAVRIAIRHRIDVSAVVKLATIKLAN